MEQKKTPSKQGPNISGHELNQTAMAIVMEYGESFSGGKTDDK